jgi:hypothetical protein
LIGIFGKGFGRFFFLNEEKHYRELENGQKYLALLLETQGNAF